MSGGRRVGVTACSNGHAFAHREGSCPECARPLHPASVSALGRLLCETTVRVNPEGRPFRLGLVRLSRRITALCIVEGATRASGYDSVRVVFKDGRFYALGAGARFSPGSPRPFSTGGDSQSS